MTYEYYQKRTKELEDENKVNNIRVMMLHEIVNNISGHLNTTKSDIIKKQDIRDYIQHGIRQMNKLVLDQYRINANI